MKITQFETFWILIYEIYQCGMNRRSDKDLRVLAVDDFDGLVIDRMGLEYRPFKTQYEGALLL